MDVAIAGTSVMDAKAAIAVAAVAWRWRPLQYSTASDEAKLSGTAIKQSWIGGTVT